MAYRDEREALRARVESLQQELERAKEAADVAGEVTRASVLSGIRLVTAGRSAALFLATSSGVRAIRLSADGTFAPATIAR